MKTTIREVFAEPLTPEAFEPFGDVMTPKGKGTSIEDFFEMGVMNLSDETPASRMQDWDIMNYWGDITDITLEPMRLGYLRPFRRKLEHSFYERHLKGTQSFIPLGGGKSVFSVAPLSDNNDPNAVPDPARMRAFLLDGTTGVTIRPGTWHWAPFPLAGPADFLILVRRNVVDDDFNFIDLEQRLGLKVRISL